MASLDLLNPEEGLEKSKRKKRKAARTARLPCYSLNILQRTRDREHPLTLTTKNDLAQLLSNQGQREQARELFEEVLHARQDVLGKKHPATLDTMYNLAKSLAEQGQFADARRLYGETLQLQRSALRPGHPDTLRTMDSFAWMLATADDVKARDPRRAVELAKEVIQHSPTESDKWNTLGVAYYRAGDSSKAIEALERSEELAPGKYIARNALFLAMAHWQRRNRSKPGSGMTGRSNGSKRTKPPIPIPFNSVTRRPSCWASRTPTHPSGKLASEPRRFRHGPLNASYLLHLFLHGRSH